LNIILTIEQLEELVQHYSAVDEFVFDVETAGPHRGDPRQNDVVWISMATEGRTDVIPMGHPNGEYIDTEYPLLPSAKIRQAKGLPLRPQDYSKDEKKAKKIFSEAPEQLTPGEVFKALKPIFMSDKRKVGHNVKFDLQSIAKYVGGLPTPEYGCTLIASFLLDNQNRINGLGLDDCLKREFGYEMIKGVGKEIEAHSFDEVAKYSGLDAEWTWKLWKTLSDRLAELKMTKLFALEMDVLQVICSMELRGADIDVSSLASLKKSLEEQLEDCKAEIYVAAGKVFNLNSVKEKQTLLYSAVKDGGRGLKPKHPTPNGKKKLDSGQRTTPQDFSVSEQALNIFAGKDAVVDGLIKYADLNKLLTTYVVPYIGGDITRTLAGKSKIVSKKALLLNGKVHTDFVQYGTETGRFSSRNPNLQNVPAPHTANGKAIRNLFIAPEGHKLIVADYSQIEPRIIASFSQDRIMTGSYLDGGDIYTTVGDTMGVDRKAGKVLVLAMAYGVGPDKIAAQIGCSITDAKELLYNFSKKFASIERYRRTVISSSRNQTPVPYVTTLLKRRRYLPDLRSKELWKRARAERQAFNTVIQGSAADIIKVAMVRAYDMIPKEASLILTVHDELVTVAPENIAEETAKAIQNAMEDIKVLNIPLLADVKIVDRWGEAK